MVTIFIPNFCISEDNCISTLVFISPNFFRLIFYLLYLFLFSICYTSSYFLFVIPLPTCPAPVICPHILHKFPRHNNLANGNNRPSASWQYSHAPVCTEHMPHHSTAISYTACTTETGCLMFTIPSAYFWPNNVVVLQTSKKQWVGGRRH